MARARKPKKEAGPPFVMLHHYVMDHPRFRALSSAAVRVLLELIRRHTGKNNGRIKLPVREGKNFGMSMATVSRSIADLVKAGFVAVDTQGTADPGKMGGNLASQYRLTFMARWDGTKQTRDWEKPAPEENPSSPHGTAPLHPCNAAA